MINTKTDKLGNILNCLKYFTKIHIIQVRPLKLDNKSLSIEQQFFADLAENSSKGASAQGGGGSNVAIFSEKQKLIGVVRSINFEGAGVTTSIDGGRRITVNIPGGGTTGDIDGGSF